MGRGDDTERNRNAVNDVRRKINEVLKKEDAKLQVGGYAPAEVTRNEGDEWVDADGRRWVQKKGWKMRQSSTVGGAVPLYCPGCGATMKPGRADTKAFLRQGKCLDCIVKEETEMQRLGTYETYAREKVKANYIALIKDKLNELRDAYDTVSEPSIVHADSEKILMIEKWHVDVDQIKTDLLEDIALLEKTLAEAEAL